LVERDILKAEWALVIDENLGFGRAQDYVRPDSPSAADKLAAAFREEDYSGLPDGELADFLSDAGRIEDQYRQMLDTLESAGTKVVRYGRDRHQRAENAFRDFGLTIIGPTQEQLLKTAEAISQFNSDAIKVAGDLADQDDPNDLVQLYRKVPNAADVEGAEDRPGKGAAINDQSIVMKLTVEGASALLGGDMQLAKAEVSGIGADMAKLRNAITQAGPYQFIKMSHHASYNAFDETLLNEWGATNFYALLESNERCSSS